MVAVDLVKPRFGDGNWELTPTIIRLLKVVGDAAGDKLSFVFLTSSASHEPVRDLARHNDLLICACEDFEHPAKQLRLTKALEFIMIPAPSDLLQRLEVDVAFCPFGTTTFDTSGIPLVPLLTDLLHKEYPYALTSAEISAREAGIGYTLWAASKIQCTSRSVMNQVLSHYNVPYNKLFCTYLPSEVLPSKRLQEKKETDKPWGGRRYFFYPANLWVHKNHEVLLLGFVRYRQLAAGNAWDLVLTYQEHARAEELRGLAISLGVAEHVHFLGKVEGEKLDEVWRNAGALVFPSLYEGFVHALVEAMQYGVPIICAEEVAMWEIAGDAYFPFDARKPTNVAEALLKVSLDEQLRAELAKRGRERLPLFDLGAAGKALLEAFWSAIRSEEEFPRMSAYMRQPPLLAVPTPASAECWKIEIIMSAVGLPKTCDVYLDDVPFGTVSSAGGSESAMSFDCRPCGRWLSLREGTTSFGNDSKKAKQSESLIKRITATNEHAHSILLYQDKEQSG